MASTKDGKFMNGIFLVMVTCVIPYLMELMSGKELLPQWYGYFMILVILYAFVYNVFIAEDD